MCNWHWSISAPDENGEMKHLASIRYLGGLKASMPDKEKALAKALRHAAGWANRHRDRRERIVITNYSCNGGHETVFPFLPGGPMVEPENEWDESSWFSDVDDEERCYVLWSSSSDEFVDRDLTISEARARVEQARSGSGDLAAFREWTGPDGQTHRLCLTDATDGAYWRLRRRPLAEQFPGIGFTVSPKEQSVELAARGLGVHPNTVRSWAERGYLDRLPSGLIAASSVEAFRRKIYGGEEDA
jgi:hypothetical protein